MTCFANTNRSVPLGLAIKGLKNILERSEENTLGKWHRVFVKD